MNDLWHRQYNEIIEVIGRLSTESFIKLVNRYMEREGSDNAIKPIEDLDLLLEQMSVLDFLNAINDTRFNKDDEYYYWDNQNTICSWDGSEEHRPTDFDEEIAEYCIEFKRNLGFSKIAKILTWREEEE